MNIKNKVVLITGGTKGIGKVTADLLTSKGMKVYVTTRKEEKVKDNVLLLDVTNEELVKKCIDDVIKKEGKIDVLINNAATNPVFGPAFQSDEPVFDKIMEVNLKGPFFLSKLVAEKMQEQE